LLVDFWAEFFGWFSGDRGWKKVICKFVSKSFLSLYLSRLCVLIETVETKLFALSLAEIVWDGRGWCILVGLFVPVIAHGVG
jgi:hypothetical protein